MTNNNGKKLRQITLTIVRDETGRFKFTSDDLDTIHDMEDYLSMALIALSRLIRQSEFEKMHGMFEQIVAKTNAEKSRIIDPNTRRPIVKKGD